MDLDTDHSWFIYVGEIKGAGLNRFLVEPLTRRYGKPAVCINIVPDIMAFYPEDIFLVVGPGSDQAGPDTPERRNARMPGRQFASLVSSDEVVTAVVKQILSMQDELVVNTFEASPELTIALDDRVRIIGPDPQVAVSLNNKLQQFKIADSMGIPVPNGRICDDLGKALDFAEKVFSRGGRVFVSGAYSAGGSHSIVAANSEEITSRFDGISDGLLVTEFIQHRHDPTVLGIVANENDIYIASVADQNILGTRFLGSTFPTVLAEEKILELKEITKTIGRYMGGQGYRGVFGCDFIVDDQGKIYFIEVNARKQGTTMETALAMIHNLPGKPSLPELEMMSVMDGCLPDDLQEMDSRGGPICWGTYNFKAEDDLMVSNYVPPSMEEEDLFAGVMEGRSGHVVLDHVGPHTHITAGGFVARVVAAGPTHEDVRKGLKTGVRQVHSSLK